MRFTSVFEGLKQIQDSWGMSSQQMAALTHVSPSVFESWMKEGRKTAVTGDTQPTIPAGMNSAVVLVSIYERLTERFPEVEKQVEWMLQENPDFEGNKPIDVAASSPSNLLWLGYYLESSRKP